MAAAGLRPRICAPLAALSHVHAEIVASLNSLEIAPPPGSFQLALAGPFLLYRPLLFHRPLIFRAPRTLPHSDFYLSGFIVGGARGEVSGGKLKVSRVRPIGGVAVLLLEFGGGVLAGGAVARAKIRVVFDADLVC